MNVIEDRGRCADCLSYNIDYGIHDIDNGQIAYDYKCVDCQGEGREYYAIEYIETISDDKEA